MLPRVIGLIGYQRVGKTTTARSLAYNYGYTWTRFADPLKKMLKAIGLTDDHVDGNLKSVPCDLLLGKTPVQAMQTLGTEWGREMIGEDLWQKLWLRNVTGIIQSGGRVVVDDCRFATEAETILGMGGELWRVERPGFSRASDHISEAYAAIAEPNLVIFNDGDKIDLDSKIRNALGL